MPPEPSQQQLLVQIDGLSRPMLERAISEGSAPTLSELADREFEIVSLYSGLPSTTPAAQGELFYGVQAAVPSFAFLEDHRTPRHMLEPSAAAETERSLRDRGKGLLDGGSSYCNIYTGGAVISRFCPAGLAGGNAGMSRGPVHHLRALASYAGVLLRATGMLIGEIARLVFSSSHIPRTAIRRRVKDSWNRILTCVAVRDAARIEASHDLGRGLPIVHVNFMGYDKQAHRYGPESAPAMRALKGIDNAIASLLRKAGPGTVVVIYSDHGQEATTPFESRTGRPIDEIVRKAAERAGVRPDGSRRRARSGEDRTLIASLGELALGVGASQEEDDSGLDIAVVQAGPIAHVSFGVELDAETLDRVGRSVAAEAWGVAVMIPRATHTPKVFFGDDQPGSPGEFVREHLVDHPFEEMIAEDLEALARHPACGDLVLLSTGFSSEAMTFADEHGSHGGAGPAETHAFALVPSGLGFGASRGPRPLRLADLRLAILAKQGRASPECTVNTTCSG